jgi:hypothetical protein
MLDIDIFDNQRGGNVAYKALAHPVAAEKLDRLAMLLNKRGPVAIYDPDGAARTLIALSPFFNVEGIYVHDTQSVGLPRCGHILRPLGLIGNAHARTVLICAFDANRLRGRIEPFTSESASVLSLDELRLPESLVTNPLRYLDAINFVTNFALFRDDDHFGTRLTTLNYWSSYGARAVRLFMWLYGSQGEVLAEWHQDAPANAGAIILESGEVRRRFDLGPFVGQLFIHAVGAAGHDVLKYALDTYATDGGASLSCTHDANAWPSEKYAGLPAPSPAERVILWLQNSHAREIPAGTLTLQPMGTETCAPIQAALPAFATLAVDVSDILPGVQWPFQFEFHAGKHVVRPRYEVTRENRTRIAHMNVERGDLEADPQITNLSPALGRGFILPFPVLPRHSHRTIVLPTPMSVNARATPLRVDVFAADGEKIAEEYLGVLPRNHCASVDLDSILSVEALKDGGHAELVYDFRGGGDADGWLHALFRYEHRVSGHAAESSFGAHIFNTIMTYKNEPQSYSGSPPGLSTKLFLKLGSDDLESFCVLIYPASKEWHARSRTKLELYSKEAELLDSKTIAIACCGSAAIRPSQLFGSTDLRRAGKGGYVLIRDSTCRLFGFHGLDDRAGKFSFDHMFGY